MQKDGLASQKNAEWLQKKTMHDLKENAQLQESLKLLA